MPQTALMVDLERCYGCRSCEAACKMENGPGYFGFRNRNVWMTPTQINDRLQFITTMCQQCERPACLRACDTFPKAISKRESDGAVLVDTTRCTGCQKCVLACPYNSMGFDPRVRKAVKCTLCVERRERGLEPACVSVCPAHALTYGVKEELLVEAAKEERVVRNIDRFAQNPSTVYLEPESRNGGGGPFPSLGSAVSLDKGNGRVVSRVTHEGNHVGALGNPFTSGVEQFPYTEAHPIIADRVEMGGCNICFNACTAKYHLKDGRLVAITANDNDDGRLDGRVCSKIQTMIQMYYSPHRLTYPMKRVGKRGEGKFERISWSQALDELAEKLKGVKEKYGGESLGIFTGTRTGALTLSGFAPLFADLFGTPNQEGTGPLCSTAMSVASQTVQGVSGGAHVYTEDDLGSSTFYLFSGYNAAEHRPVCFGLLNDWRVKHKAKMVVIDPMQTPTASKADQWLPIRAGTDMALVLGMMHYIITNDLVDKPFIEKWVEGYDKIKEFILEKKYTPEWAAVATDLPKETIEQLARDYATAERAVIFTGRGLTQQSNGVQTNRVWQMLAAITGNWGKKGAGFVGTGSGSVRPGNMRAPKERNAIKRRGIRKSPVGWIEAMKTGKPYPMKALLMTCDALVNWPGQAKLREALPELDVIAYIGLFPMDSALWADYVFPAAPGIEAGDVTRGSEDRRVAWIPKLIDPPGEAKPDGYFWVELGKRLGFDDVIKEEYKDPEVFWDAMVQRGAKGLTIKRLRASPRGWLRGPLPEEDSKETGTLFMEGSVYPGDKKGRRFPTPSGKLELWTEELEGKFNQYGLSALPEFYTSPEQLIDLPYLEYLHTDADEGVPSPFWDNELNAPQVRIVNKPRGERKEYDTELVTGRPPAPHFHSWTHWLWQPQQMWPDLFARIHPEKAAAIGVKDGDRVVIESPRGRIEALAWVSSGIRKTSIYIPMGWGDKQPFNPWKSVNWLMPIDQRCPMSDQANLKATLCRISKA